MTLTFEISNDTAAMLYHLLTAALEKAEGAIRWFSVENDIANTQLWQAKADDLRLMLVAIEEELSVPEPKLLRSLNDIQL